MLIYIIHNDYIYTYRLPKDIGGNYMLNDIDVNGRTRSLVNISGEDNKWYFNANEEVSVFSNGGYSEKVEIKPYSFYTLTYYEKENILLYVFPGYDKSFIVKEIKDNCSLIIGKGANCDIVYDSKNIEEKQLQLDYKNGTWKYTNLGVKTPIYINKKRDNSTFIDSFDSIFIMGLKITIVGKKLIISFIPGSLRIKDNILVEEKQVFAVEDNPSREIVKEFYSMYDYFYKSPIFKKKYDEYKAVITPPEAKEKNTGNNIISEVVPSALMSVSSLVALYFTVSNGGSYVTSPETAAQYKETLITSAVMCIIMLITGIAWPIIEHLAARIRRFISARVRVFNYKRYLKRKDEELKTIIDEEKNVLFFNNLSLKECQEAILKKNANLFGRNIESDSFLNIKCGEGKVKSSIVFDYQKPDMIVQNDKLYDEIDNLVDKYQYIEDASFVFKLKNTSLAVIDSTKDYSNYLNSIILQLITLYDYNNLKLVVLTHEGSNLNSIRNLNHVWNNDRSFRYFATNLHEAENISTELVRIWNSFNNDQVDLKNKAMVETYYVIISDCIEDYKGLKIINTILKNNKNVDSTNCMSLLMFTDRVTNIPNGCEYFINYNDDMCSFFNSEMDEKNITKFKPNTLTEDINFYGCIENLCNIPIKVNNDNAATNSNLPTKLGFLEMYGVGKIEQLNIIEKWKNAPIASTLAAPVGVDSNNNTIMLDLHEKKHGPHGLIAGMTGSGKSEFIITYILSLAVNYSPYEVQFVLIDYKGGSLAGAFENRKTGKKLPHLVGTITNLDVSSMNRSLVSIDSEIKRRQKLFNEVKENLNTGTLDIYKYQKLYRDGLIDESLSHLFIICDEFAELKANQPEFMDKLISIARIGRSLGVHLILSTQKPSGVVDDQIWSNAKFKICCKVQTTEDSNEMIRKPDAAYLKDSGRFYLQVGYDEIFTIGQSAFSGNSYISSDTIIQDYSKSIEYIDNTGSVYKTDIIEDNIVRVNHDGDELKNVLDYIIECSNEIGYKNKNLWLDSISNELVIGNLIKKYIINTLIGEYDDPSNQKQGPVYVDITTNGNLFISGITGSGKTTLLQSFIYSTILFHSTEEVNFYIVDFISDSLKVYNDAPQIGNILGNGDNDKIEKLFNFLDYEVNKRKNKISLSDGTYLNSINQGNNDMPNIIVVINGIDVFKDVYDELYNDLFIPLSRDGSRFGINFIVTGVSAVSLTSNVEGNFPQKIGLQFTDNSEYNLLFSNVNGLVPHGNPGRGLIKIDNIYEFQVARISGNDTIERDISLIIEELKAHYDKANGIPIMPRVINSNLLINNSYNIDSVPIGIEIKNNCSFCYDFSKFITSIFYSNYKYIEDFIISLTKLISMANNTKVIVLDAIGNLEVYEKCKYFDSNFIQVIPALIENIDEKKKIDNYNENIVFIINGYDRLEKHLKENRLNDLSVKTISDLINYTKDFNNYKFVLFDSIEYSKIEDYEWFNLFDSSNGILFDINPDEQDVFVFDDDYSNIKLNKDIAIVIKNNKKKYIKYSRR